MTIEKEGTMIAHNKLGDGLSPHQTCFSCVCHSHDIFIQNESHEKSGKMLLGKINAGSAFLGTIFSTVLFIWSIFSIFEDASTKKIYYINDCSYSF